ncbi:MAG: hypothetical protein AAGI23_10940 [Bacteroidota bacterium]
MGTPAHHHLEKEKKNTFWDRLIRIYQKFSLFAEIQEGDHWTIMIGKIIVRIMGLLFLLALSPFLLLGLTVAFLLAG